MGVVPFRGSEMSGRVLEMDFRLVGLTAPGTSVPLAKAVGYRPKRTLAGWLLPFLTVSAINGSQHLIVDRDDQTFDAATRAGAIDWSGFINHGFWSDTHSDRLVGVPTYLDYHAPESALAKAHGCAGWFQAGHLFDRAEPESWREFLTIRPARPEVRASAGVPYRPATPEMPYTPTTMELDRADYLWHAGEELAKAGGSLGFSVEGRCWFSPCNRRIVRARILGAAVALTPKNPWAAAVPLEQTLQKAVAEQGAFLRAFRETSGRQCGRCRCEAPCAVVQQQNIAGEAEALRDVLRARYADKYNLTEAEADMHLRTAFGFLRQVTADRSASCLF